MAIEVYSGQRFRYGHERRALGIFVQDLLDRYESIEETFFVLFEVQAGTAAMDVLLLSHNAMVIVEFKELTAVSDLGEASRVYLQGKQNGPWDYILPNGTQYRLGGKDKRTNPYNQLEQLRYGLADWIAEHSCQALNQQWSRQEALNYLSAWVVITPSIDETTSQLDLDWAEIKRRHNWFRVLALSNLAWEFNCTSSRFQLGESQLRGLIRELGVSRVENLGEVLPHYIPPPPKIPFFNRPPASGLLIGRDTEVTTCRTLLADPICGLIALRGPGGIGKTELAIHLAREANATGMKVRWVNCAEREVTEESFLTAVAMEIPDRERAKLVLSSENIRLVDRMDMALDYLEQFAPLLLVFDDFDNVKPGELDRLLTRLIRRADRMKTMLISREIQECLDNPAWSTGSTREVLVPSLSLEALRNIWESNPSISPLTIEQLHLVGERTSGNPYALRLLMVLVKRHGWDSKPAELPLYNAAQSEPWVVSQLEILSVEARDLAAQLAVVRSGLSQDLICFLAHKGEERGLELLRELREKFIIQPTNTLGQFKIPEFLREYLYDTLPIKRKLKAHGDAGRHFEKLADSVSSLLAQADYLVESVYHFHKSEDVNRVVSVGEHVFGLLLDLQDRDRIQAISTKVVEILERQSRPDTELLASWLLRLAEVEAGYDHVEKWNRCVLKAADCLKVAKPLKASTSTSYLAHLKIQLYLHQGRLAYRKPDYGEALEKFSEALKLAQETESQEIAQAMFRLGQVHRHLGRWDQAREYLVFASKIADKHSNYVLLVECKSHAGLMYRQMGEFEKAGALFAEAYEDAEKSGNARAAEINLGHLGDLARRRGDLVESERLFRECLERARRLNNGLAIRVDMGQLAEALIAQGKYEESDTILDELETLCRRAEDGLGLAWLDRRRGLLLKAMGQREEGNRLVVQGIERLHALGNKVYLEDFNNALMQYEPGQA